MAIFFGYHMLNVDTSGRFVLPSEYRLSLGKVCYVTKGIGCLLLMSPDFNTKLQEQIKQQSSSNLESMFNRNLSKISRHIYSGMSIVYPELDKNFRITLNNEQKSYSGINKACVLIGVGDYIEIWDPEKYNVANKSLEEPENLYDLGNSLFNLPDKDKHELS